MKKIIFYVHYHTFTKVFYFDNNKEDSLFEGTSSECVDWINSNIKERK